MYEAFALVLRYDKMVGRRGFAAAKRQLSSTLTLLRKAARLSRRQFAREADIDPRILKAVESGVVPVSSEVLGSIKKALRERNVSETSISLLDAAVNTDVGQPTVASFDISRSDLTTIERSLSDISNKLSSLASDNPGRDIKAIVNRLDATNEHLRQIANNTTR